MPGYTVRVMSDRDVIAALVSDLHWQIDQIAARDQEQRGQPVQPVVLQARPAERDRRGTSPSPSTSGATCTSRRATASRSSRRPTRWIWRARRSSSTTRSPTRTCSRTKSARIARQRLAPHVAAIERRRAASQSRVEATRRTLPEGLDDLRALATAEANPEDSMAINTEIIRRAPDDVVTMIRLGRAYEALGQLEQAVAEYERALLLEPANRIVERRLRDAERQLQRRSRTR